MQNDDEFDFPADPRSKWTKFLHMIDLFIFIPVPRTNKVSGKASIIASMALIIVFVGYVAFSLFNFFTNNTPRLSQVSIPLDQNFSSKLLIIFNSNSARYFFNYLYYLKLKPLLSQLHLSIMKMQIKNISIQLTSFGPWIFKQYIKIRA